MTTRTDIPAISVVIPLRNEAGNIAPLLEEIATAMANGPAWEALCVDDGSTDTTAAEVAALAPRLPVTLIHHHRSFGQSASLHTGIVAARAELIVTLDGDGQNDPADIPNLLAEYQRAHAAEGTPAPALIIGHRTKRRDSTAKKLASRLARWARRVLLGEPTPDTGCALKVFPKALYLRFPMFNHNHRFLTVLARHNGATVISVPVNHRPRGEGRSNYGVIDRLTAGIFDICGLLWLRARHLPPPEHRRSSDRPSD